MLTEPDHPHSNPTDRPHLTSVQLLAPTQGSRGWCCPVSRTSVSGRLIVDSRLARLYRLDGGGIRFPSRTYLPLSFAGSVAIKQPYRSLHLFFFLQILRLARNFRNPRDKILAPGPRCVLAFERPFSLNLYYSGGSHDYLRNREDSLGTAPSSSPTRSGRRIRTPGLRSRQP